MKKFYGVIGNPPYQESDGGHEASATPLYHHFAEESMEVAEKVCLVTPSRWFAGGKGLDSFRKDMLESHKLKSLVDFQRLYEPFPNVKIRGGVSYFVWDSDYDGPCTVQSMEGGKPLGEPMARYLDAYDVLVRNNEAVAILDKVVAFGEPTLDARVATSKPFGLRTFVHGEPTPNGLSSPIKLYESQRVGWIERDEITVNSEWIDDWKVLTNAVSGTSAAVETQFLSKPIVAAPGEACTETYLVAGRFDDEAQARNYASYLRTRFVRFLVSLRKIGQHVTRGVFSFVPDLDYSHAWTDAELYAKYCLSEDEIAFIESHVKEMS